MREEVGEHKHHVNKTYITSSVNVSARVMYIDFLFFWQKTTLPMMIHDSHDFTVFMSFVLIERPLVIETTYCVFNMTAISINVNSQIQHFINVYLIAIFGI